MIRRRDPLIWILFIVGILHAIGIGWGLPASDGWDNDGVAPRDFLPGLAATFTPGRYYTYPPVQLAILAVLTLPITLVALVRAPSLAIHDLVAEMIKVPYMTAIAYVARGVSLAMSIGIVYFLARFAEEVRAYQLGVSTSDPRARRAGWCTAAFAGCNVALAYYGHTTNLDVPYLFWGTWSLLEFARAIVRGAPLARAVALAVLAVGTKDQAYAMFLLSYPIALWLARRKPALRDIGIAIGLFLLVDAVIVNPTGFAARVRFLTGSASKDYVEYAPNWSGRFGVLVTSARSFWPSQYPLVFAPFIVFGAVHTMIGKRPALAVLPLLVALSSTLAFNFMSLRTDARFLLPQALALSIYGGRAVEVLAFTEKRTLRIVGQLACSIAFAIGIFHVVCLDVTLLHDPRYEAEAWLRDHVAPGETIETYGLNVYLPRMPAQARVIRVGPEPTDKRNPLPGVEEVQAAFEKAPERGARWIVLSSDWGWRYLTRRHPPVLQAGQAVPPTWTRAAADEAATRWFEDLTWSRDAFAIAHESKYELENAFPPIDVHGTTVPRIWIYERKPGH